MVEAGPSYPGIAMRYGASIQVRQWSVLSEIICYFHFVIIESFSEKEGYVKTIEHLLLLNGRLASSLIIIEGNKQKGRTISDPA